MAISAVTSASRRPANNAQVPLSALSTGYWDDDGGWSVAGYYASESALFDALHSDLAIVLKETRDDGVDAKRLATWMLENDGDRQLMIGVIEGTIAASIYNRPKYRKMVLKCAFLSTPLAVTQLLD